MKGTFLAAAALVVCLAPAVPAPAAAQGLTATLDRTEATVEDQLVLTLTVEGSTGARPVLPELPAFDVVGRGQSQQMQIVNGRVSTSVSYNYLLLPRRPGSFTLGAARVEIDGRVYESAPLDVKILEAGREPRGSREIFLTAEVSERRPYVGQQVVYVWRLYRRLQLADARLEPIEFEGFTVEDLGEVREYDATVGGRRYRVSELRKALFPQEEGTLTIPGSRLTCKVVRGQGRGGLFDDFFGRADVDNQVLRTRPIEIVVRPLPPPPAGTGGFSGLVGEFDLQARLSKEEARVGESATLEVTVAGTGNVQLITPPPMPELPGLKIYEDEPASSIERGGGALRGSKSFRRALVPLSPGEITVPALELTYFDPAAERYRVASTTPLTLRVRPGEGREELRLTEALAPTTGKVAVKILADDILPIHKGLDAVAAVGGAPRRVLAWGGFVLPPLFFAVLFVFHRRRERYRDDALRRRRDALRRALGELKTRGPGDEAEVSRLLRAYVGDKLGFEGTALTAAEVDERLRRHGVEEALVDRVHRLLDRLEAARYGGAAAVAGGSRAEVEELLRQLERQLGS